MRSSTWLLGVSLIMPFAAITLSGCGSSSNGSGTGGSGGKVGSGGSNGSGGSSGSGGGAGGADAGAACTPMTSSAATIDAGTLWGCLETACMTQLVACASDCVCNNAVLAALQCVAGGGNQMTCFTPLASAGSGGLSVVTCLLMSTATCNPNVDAGSEGPGDSAADAPAGSGG